MAHLLSTEYFQENMNTEQFKFKDSKRPKNITLHQSNFELSIHSLLTEPLMRKFMGDYLQNPPFLFDIRGSFIKHQSVMGIENEAPVLHCTTLVWNRHHVLWTLLKMNLCWHLKLQSTLLIKISIGTPPSPVLYAIARVTLSRIVQCFKTPQLSDKLMGSLGPTSINSSLLLIS